jgi:hypothetical protein
MRREYTERPEHTYFYCVQRIDYTETNDTTNIACCKVLPPSWFLSKKRERREERGKKEKKDEERDQTKTAQSQIQQNH